MGIYLTSLKLSSCEVGGFVASALIHDLRVNNFTFTNFPEVDVKRDDEQFYITLKIEGASSPTFSIDYETVKNEVSRFRGKKEVSKEVFEIIQKHSTNGYKSPAIYEMEWWKNRKAA
jgi:hypothetical protein